MEINFKAPLNSCSGLEFELEALEFLEHQFKGLNLESGPQQYFFLSFIEYFSLCRNHLFPCVTLIHVLSKIASSSAFRFLFVDQFHK